MTKVTGTSNRAPGSAQGLTPTFSGSSRWGIPVWVPNSGQARGPAPTQASGSEEIHRVDIHYQP